MSMSTQGPIFSVLEPVVQPRDDGSILLSVRNPLPEYARCITDRIHYWAAATPDVTALAQRDASGAWRKLSYAEVRDQMRRIGAAMLARGLSVERPVLVLSGNDIEHALIALGCMEVGIPYCPISTAYSLISQDYGKLRYAFELLTPGLVYATQGAAYAKAIKACTPAGVEVVIGDGTAPELGATPFADLLKAEVTPTVEAAHRLIDADTIAKFLLTSGSTGFPKAVTNTQRMLTANQVMIRECMVFLKNEPPVMLDWLPWAHTFGSNHNFGIALYNGGTLYIDEGKPVPGAVEATVRNIRDVSPTIYFNVPKGYEALLPYLHADEELRQKFFGRMKFLFYAGAGLSKPVWDELKALSVQTTGQPVRIITSLGSTETAPAAVMGNRDVDRPGIVGLPMPGVTMKLVPNNGKLEARIRGANITPGYYKRDDLTQDSFDEEGFYKLGDALKPVNKADWSEGLVFDGRVSEDFKLATGTWVSVGPLRGHILACCSPLVSDVVVAGHDRDDIRVLAFPDPASCRKLADLPESTPMAEVLGHPAVRKVFEDKLSVQAKEATGSSNRVVAAMLVAEPPAIDLGEITDKGSLNQRAVLSHRAVLVEELYSEHSSERVIYAKRK